MLKLKSMHVDTVASKKKKKSGKSTFQIEGIAFLKILGTKSTFEKNKYIHIYTNI